MRRLIAGGPDRDNMSQARILATLVVVNFVSISGFGMLLPVFALYGKQIGASGTEVTWAIAAFSLGQLLSGALFGRLSDHYGRRPLMMAGMLGTSLLYVAQAFATLPELLILARFGAGICSGSFALSFAAGSDISTPATRARILGIVGAGFSFGFVFGPAIGGVAAGLVAEQQAFAFICLLGAGMSLAAALATLFFLPETRRAAHPDAEVGNHRTADLFRQRDFNIVLVMCLAGTVGMSMLWGVFVLYADDVLHLTPLGIGMMYTVVGIFGVLTQAGAVGPVAERIGEHWMLVIAMLVVCLGILAVGSTRSVVPALVAMSAVAVGFSLLNTATTALASLIAVEALQGTALGLVQAVTSLGRFLGPALGGPIYDVQGPSAPFYWGAAIIFAFGLAAAMWRPAVGRRPRREQTP